MARTAIDKKYQYLYCGSGPLNTSILELYQYIRISSILWSSYRQDMVFRKSKQSEYIGRKPASNIYHGIKLANTLQLPLNLFVSINFTLTSCPVDNVSKAFQQLRDTFAKWVTRPPALLKNHKAAPTYVWVIENPPSAHINVHWLVHVPEKRQADFKNRLIKWLHSVTGEILDDKSINIRKVYSARGVGSYMLKGIHPGVAVFYGIRPEAQGWIHGKRSGFSRNIGPTQKRYLRECGKYPKARYSFSAVL